MPFGVGHEVSGRAFDFCGRLRPRWQPRIFTGSTGFRRRSTVDFAFDRLTSCRSPKCRTTADDATQETVAIQPDTAISGVAMAALKQLKNNRGLPKVIRSDNRQEFRERAMAIWAPENGGHLRFIEPSAPTRNSRVESFNGR